jgi:S-adenosylmethionine hydrolase
VAKRPVITLTTDFGLHDHFVGTLKGVILGIAPDAAIVDICHAVPSFDILDGALTIAAAYKYFPNGTVHIVVVDPGVGSLRRPIVGSTGAHRFVAPDNGVLSAVYDAEPAVQVRHITAESYFLQPVSRTFHARDIFAPVAAHLAAGVDGDAVGPEITDFVRLDTARPTASGENTWRGTVLKVDRFGNLITNIAAQNIPRLFQASPPAFKLVIANREIDHLRFSYSEAAPGEAFAIVGSMGYLEIAVNQASAGEILGVGKGAEFTLSLKPPRKIIRL